MKVFAAKLCSAEVDTMKNLKYSANSSGEESRGFLPRDLAEEANKEAVSNLFHLGFTVASSSPHVTAW